MWEIFVEGHILSTGGDAAKSSATCYVKHWNWRTTERPSGFFEELKNIENQVAWFLAELCKAQKKGVQKDKRNQCWTELILGGI
jgi:hypothetical protein